jgi:hypothetical protein
VTRDRHRNGGLFSGILRGVSHPREGSKILSSLFRPLVYSSLLHLRTSWKVHCANFALVDISEILHSPGPMRQGFLCAIGDSKLCVHTLSTKLSPSSQICCEIQEICRKRR